MNRERSHKENIVKILQKLTNNVETGRCSSKADTYRLAECKCWSRKAGLKRTVADR